MKSEKHHLSNAEIPEQLRLYNEMIIQKTTRPDLRLSLAPSAIPFGEIKISALDGGGLLWFVSPKGNSLLRCPLLGGKTQDVSVLVENKKPDLLYIEGGALWAMAGEAVYKIPVTPIKKIPSLGKAPRQKYPRYYSAGDPRVSEKIKCALNESKAFKTDDLLDAIENIVALCSDAEGGRFAALPRGVMHFSAQTAFDRRLIELYHGGRFVFANDFSVNAVAFVEGELWIQNDLGYVRVSFPRISLSEKEKHYDRLAWELHSVRGSICDTNYTAEDFGNEGKLEQTKRYSTNNDALWSVFHSIGDALKYSYLRKIGDIEAAENAREKLVRVTKNVLLQSHIHGLGNGFVARAYVSRRDAVFIKDGKIDTNGLWFKKDGVAEDGSRFLECADTPLARFGCSLPDGRNFLLTPEVKARLNTNADRPLTDDFRLTAPICAEVPPLLAQLYQQPDPYRPEKYPASDDADIIYKADTSSEEAIAAFVQYYFVWKHLICAAHDEETAALGELIADTAAATITYILDNDFCLRDLHGNSTQWGKWFADYFVRWPSLNEPWRHPSYAFSDGPLNGAELMCMLKICIYILKGNEKHKALYKRLKKEYEQTFEEPFDGKTNGAGYASLLKLYRENLRYTCEQTAEISDYTLGINYSDETLAIITFWPLIELEEDSARKAILRQGLDEWWHNMKREGNPIYTFAYAVLSPGEQIDLNPAIDYLNRLPLYPNKMPVENSTRNDLIMLGNLWDTATISNTLLPIDERRVHKFNGSPFEIDAEGEKGENIYKGSYLYSGNIFTWPYWTAKYYGLTELD